MRPQEGGIGGCEAEGIQLGNPNLVKTSASGVSLIKRNADAFAQQVLPVIREIQQGGARSLRAVAQVLAARGSAHGSG
jgi:hypothetical protein